jgi:hypothetical protein
MCIDAATKCGFARGRAGEKPRAWSQTLKGPQDDPERAFRKLGILLRDQFTLAIPDLVVVEAPMLVGAMAERDRETGEVKFKSSPQTHYLLTGLAAVVFGISGPYGARAIKANVQRVRKHVLGKGRPQNPKRAVLERMWQIGWMDRSCKDDNSADAAAMFLWASDTYGKPATRELHMFGEAP